MIHHIIAHEGKNKFMSKFICGEILLSLTTLKCRHFAVKNNESDTPGLQQTNGSLQNLKGHDPCNCPLPMAFDTPKWKLSPNLNWPSKSMQFRKLNHVSQEEVCLKISYLLDLVIISKTTVQLSGGTVQNPGNLTNGYQKWCFVKRYLLCNMAMLGIYSKFQGDRTLLKTSGQIFLEFLKLH